MPNDLSFDLLKARVQAYEEGPRPSEVKVNLDELRQLILELERLYSELGRPGQGAAS